MLLVSQSGLHQLVAREQGEKEHSYMNPSFFILSELKVKTGLFVPAAQGKKHMTPTNDNTMVSCCGFC